MDNRSSTSSSSTKPNRLPLAGLLAAVALLVADSALLGDRAAWDQAAERMPTNRQGELGVVRDRVALAALRGATADQIRVAVVGSSRAAAGFITDLASREMPEAVFVKLAHPGVEPFVIRAAVEEVRAAGVDAVVLVLSELDTHRPLRLEPIPGPGSATVGLVAVPDLLAATGIGFAWQNRDSLYRLVVAAALRGYRYRGVLEGVGLSAPITFATAKRLVGTASALNEPRRIALGDKQPRRVSATGRQRVQAELAKIHPMMLPAAMVEIDIVSEIGNGQHVAVQMALLRRSVARLREAGIAVLVAEGPVNPVTSELYNVHLRRSFLAFAKDLALAEGVWFAPLEEFEPFGESDFLDLLHTTPGGAAKLTRGIVKRLRTMAIHRPENS